VESYVRRLATELVRRGGEVLVVGSSEPDPGWPAGLAGLRTVPDYSLVGAPPEKTAAILRLAAEFRPDVVHIHEMNNYPLALELARRFPVVKHVHIDCSCAVGGARFWRRPGRPCFRVTSPACLWHYYFHRCGPGLDPRWAIWSYRRSTGALATWRGMRKVLVASEFMRASLIKAGFAEGQVETLPYFVPDVPESGGVRPAAEPPGILFVGRIMPEKGLADLVRALPLVRLSCRLAVVGDGPARAAAEQLAGRLIPGRAEFAGWLSDVEPYYARAAMLAVPSLWPEPSGIVGLEAMARGLPVVAYRSGGIPEWLVDGQTGLLAEPGDVWGLARAIEQLLADPALARRLGEAGRERQRERFGPEKHVRRLEEIFEEAVAAAR
jgi:glycosyltransferase involved in cell wall biosynthesis